MHICPVLLSPCPFWRPGRNAHLGIEDMNSLPVAGCEGIWNNVQRYFHELTYPGNQVKKKKEKEARSCNENDPHWSHSDTTATAVTSAVSMATSETRLERQYECASSV